MIKRYQIEVDCSVAVLFNIDGVTNNSDVIEDYENYEWCKYSDVEQLQARIKELESQSHINEIKAQGIEEAISYSQRELLKPKYVAYHWKLLCKQYIEQLRTKHE